MLSKYILIKKLLTLLGSVAVIGSTAAVAIACEGKTLGVVVKNAGTPEVKDQKQILSEESSDEGKSASQPGKNANNEEFKKQLGEAEKLVKEKEEKVKQASRKYSEASNKGRPYEQGSGNAPKEIVDKINESEKELLKAQNELKDAKHKLFGLRDKSRTANEGDATGATIGLRW
ncbi:lipoprotein [Mycoplasma mycoides]|uniref:lipoprotein n=1 Tax=Mycoplasma mycoides TaxID=2102 RepID=UPI0034E577D1